MRTGCSRQSAGFTLLELVVIITVIGILAAAVTPAVIQQLLDRRISSTQEEARTLHEGMVGDHSQMRFGFVGDLGQLPSTLTQLVQRGGLPNYTTATIRAASAWAGAARTSTTAPRAATT